MLNNNSMLTPYDIFIRLIYELCKYGSKMPRVYTYHAIKQVRTNDDSPATDLAKVILHSSIFCRTCGYQSPHFSDHSDIKSGRILIVNLGQYPYQLLNTSTEYQPITIPETNLEVNGYIYKRLLAFLHIEEHGIYTAYLLTNKGRWVRHDGSEFVFANPTPILCGQVPTGPSLLVYGE